MAFKGSRVVFVKAALAQALVTAPDVLLLDEPTNHLGSVLH